MSGKTTANYREFYAWVAAEAVTEEVRVHAPYPNQRNQNGAPDITLAGGGRVVLVYVRTVSDPDLSAVQKWWVKGLPEESVLVVVPTREGKATMRELLAEMSDAPA